MASASLTTFQDLIQHLLDYIGDDARPSGQRHTKRAILAAYRDFPTAHRWSYYYQRGRVTTVAPYKTGTVAYANSSRIVTLTGGTFPTWAAFGRITINDINYEIATRESNTSLKLSVNSNPGADIAAGTSFTLFRDAYPMPCDFISSELLMELNQSNWMEHSTAGDWFMMNRGQQTPGTPRRYTFFADPNYVSSMAVGFWPPPDAIFNFDFIYQRRPRPLHVDRELSGTISTTSGLAVVTGDGTKFSSDKHVGSILRISANSTDYPTGYDGANPLEFERTIMSVASATSLTVDSNLTSALSKVKYEISDPIDVENGTMLTAFIRLCEKEIAMIRRLEDREMVAGWYLESLVMARESDSRSFARRERDGNISYESWLRSRPVGADVA